MGSISSFVIYREARFRPSRFIVGLISSFVIHCGFDFELCDLIWNSIQSFAQHKLHDLDSVVVRKFLVFWSVPQIMMNMLFPVARFSSSFSAAQRRFLEVVPLTVCRGSLNWRPRNRNPDFVSWRTRWLFCRATHGSIIHFNARNPLLNGEMELPPNQRLRKLSTVWVKFWAKMPTTKCRHCKPGCRVAVQRPVALHGWTALLCW